MNWIKKLFTQATVKAAVLGLVKALLTAGLSIAGMASLSGCSALQKPSSKTQSSSVYAFGLPAIVITHDNTQLADGSGADTNTTLAEDTGQGK